MPESEHEQLIPNLRAMIAGDGSGLEIDSEKWWAVTGIAAPIPFFQSLSKILPSGSVLYMEGEDIRPWAADLYERYVPAVIVPVARDTIAPMPKMFHVVFSDVLIGELCEMAQGRETRELFYHIKGYCGQKLLFTFHDAFSGQLLISGDIAEPMVAEFCGALGVPYMSEPAKKRDKAGLKRILFALENGGRFPVPFWKRIWNYLSGRRSPF